MLKTYPSPDTPDDPTGAKYATTGYGFPTAVNVSSIATGHQQRAYVRIKVRLLDVHTDNNIEHLLRSRHGLSVILDQRRTPAQQVVPLPVLRPVRRSRRRYSGVFWTYHTQSVPRVFGHIQENMEQLYHQWQPLSRVRIRNQTLAWMDRRT